MSNLLAIRNGRVIDPVSGLDEVLTLYIGHTRILSLGEPPNDFQPHQVIDAAGKLIIPGVIDLACRMREPGQEHKDHSFGRLCRRRIGHHHIGHSAGHRSGH